MFDKGANDKKNLERILLDGHHYLTSKRLNRSDDKVFQCFDKKVWERIDAVPGVYALKRKFPSRVDYYFFSEKLQKEHLASRRRKAVRQWEQANMLEKRAAEGRPLPKNLVPDNPLVDIHYTYWTRVAAMEEKEGIELLLGKAVKRREGCFCLVSDMDMDAKEALRIYRSKDAIEKLFRSLKSDIEVKPLRVWSDDAVYGVLLLGFIARLMICLTRHFVKPVKSVSTKFIAASLQNLTETVVFGEDGRTQRHYSNFDALNKAILKDLLAGT